MFGLGEIRQWHYEWPYKFEKLKNNNCMEHRYLPCARFYDYDPRMIVDTVQKGNEAEITYILENNVV